MTIDIDSAVFIADVARQRASDTVIVPNVVGGVEHLEGRLFFREDPNYPDRHVTGAHGASAELVNEAVATARVAQREWERVPPAERAARVGAGVSFVAAHKQDWATRLAVETGKSINAIEAEVDEVRGFLDIYSSLGADPGAFVDDLNGSSAEMASETILRPYGVFGVITPFNYPIALAAGLSIGAVIAGNGLVIKTAEHGPWSGQAVYELFSSMDLPDGLVNVVHGGPAVGQALVNSDVDGIGFTGSAAVGHSIIRQFAEGPFVKPVIAEMGGKNPVIVTDGADLDTAVQGIVYSGYDLAGQKCSSGSRVLATPGAYEKVVDLVGKRVRQLHFGDTIEGASVFAGPVTAGAAVERYQRLIAAAKEAGCTVTVGSRPSGDGYFVPPTLISDVPEDHPLAREEHFLPVVTVSKVESFEQALEAANAVPFGLTAGIFTGSRAEAVEFLERVEAGCINVNGKGHATTGFLPGLQTFGGWKGSASTGKQAYGKWYLQQFAREQTRKFPVDFAGLR